MSTYTNKYNLTYLKSRSLLSLKTSVKRHSYLTYSKDMSEPKKNQLTQQNKKQK